MTSNSPATALYLEDLVNQLDDIVQTMASRMVVPRRPFPETDK